MLYLKNYPYKAVITHFVLFNAILSFLLAASISVLLKFDSSSRLALHDFLNQSPRNWYCNYYAKSSYYRLKKEAVEEFVRCLDI